MDALSRKPCRRCLLEDMPDEAALAKNMQELIALLPDDKRADEDARLSRLAVCRTCDHLNRGMCALCGCYVELRAAKKHMGCADVPSRWGPA